MNTKEVEEFKEQLKIALEPMGYSLFKYYDKRQEYKRVEGVEIYHGNEFIISVISNVDDEEDPIRIHGFICWDNMVVGEFFPIDSNERYFGKHIFDVVSCVLDVLETYIKGQLMGE